MELTKNIKDLVIEDLDGHWVGIYDETGAFAYHLMIKNNRYMLDDGENVSSGNITMEYIPISLPNGNIQKVMLEDFKHEVLLWQILDNKFRFKINNQFVTFKRILKTE